VNDARWERIKATFEAVLASPVAERPAILDRECGDDAELRSEVESLLDARTQAAVRTGGAAHALAAAAAGSAAIAEQRGEMVGRYKLLEPIGDGGFGSVWMAEQREPVKRRVAIKIIKLGMDTRQVIARFEAERQALAMMDHPNIAKVFDAGSTETGRPYFVMEYIKGVPICEYCDTHSLDTEARLDLFTSVCHAIQHAHQKGIIHRDIKPSNVLVTMHDGVPVPKVIDFGIAKATNSELTTKTLFTEHRQLIGTPAYMSPEQAEMTGLDIDTRSDIYSLGVLLYELLTGTTPFAHKELMSKGFAEMMRIIREVEPHKPSTRLSSLGESGTGTSKQRLIGDPKTLGLAMRGDLDWIVMKCLEKDRTRRYETASGLAADIKRHLNNETVTAGAPSAGYRFRKFVKRNRGQVIAGGVVAGALVLGVIGTSAGLVWALSQRTHAIESANAADAAKGEEAKARRRAETITSFVTTALKSSDAQNSGVAATGADAVHDMTILAAMDNALNDIDSGRFRDDPETEAALRDTIGVILTHNGKYEKARPLLEQALAMRERLLTGDDLIVAASLNNLAELHFYQGHFAEAEPLFVRALAIVEHALGPDDAEVANSLNNLAVLYGATGKEAEAGRLLTRALAIREKALDPDDPELARSLSNLAVYYRLHGQYSQAESLHTRALAIREKALGPDNVDVANTLLNLSQLGALQDRHAQAQPLAERALRIYEKALGPDHPLVATTLNSLGQLLQRQGAYPQAEPLFTRALAIVERASGPDHPDVAASLINLASLYRAQGAYARAEPLFTRTLAIRENALGPDHLDVAADLNSLADFYVAQGRYGEAEPLLTRALAIHEKSLAPDHPHVATNLNSLAELYLAQGKFAQAEPLFTRALAIRERVLEPDHLNVAVSLNNLAALYVRQGLYPQAEPLFVRALAIREKALGPDHDTVAAGLSNLGTLSFMMGQFARAETFYMRALAINEKALGPYHPSLAQNLSSLAHARQSLGKTAEAREGFDRAISMLRQLSQEGSPLMARVLWQSASARLGGESTDVAAALLELDEAVAAAEKLLAPEHPHLKEYRETLAKCREAIAK
jgi:eukaryotic-like serine/threonine-protein kinase